MLIKDFDWYLCIKSDVVLMWKWYYSNYDLSFQMLCKKKRREICYIRRIIDWNIAKADNDRAWEMSLYPKSQFDVD